jgi:TRAP-type C4-dicarboxylate transport system permease small subunit
LAEIVHVESKKVYTGYGKVLDVLCKTFAVLSGLMLVAIALMSLGSIVGRSIFSQALVGDFELVQMMSAVAVALSLPYANWIGGHVIVDFFTMKAPTKVNAALDAVAYLIMGFFAAVLAWRLMVGLLDLRSTFDASLMLNIPTWWAYAPMVPAFVLLSLTAFYSVYQQIRKFQS